MLCSSQTIALVREEVALKADDFKAMIEAMRELGKAKSALKQKWDLDQLAGSVHKRGTAVQVRRAKVAAPSGFLNICRQDRMCSRDRALNRSRRAMEFL